MRILSYIMFLGLLACAKGEGIAFRALDADFVHFQIQDAKATETYSIDLFELGGSEPVTSIAGFRSRAIASIFETEWRRSLPDGVYQYKLRRGAAYADELDRPFALRDTMEVAFAEVDRLNGALSLRIGQPALYRLMAGVETGMFIEQISPWRFGDGALVEQAWSFMTQGSEIDYAQHPGLMVYAQYIPIEGSVIVLGHRPFDAYRTELSNHAESLVPDRIIEFEVALGEEVFGRFPTEGAPIVQKGTPLRVKLADQSRAALERGRFEVLIYVDGEFIHEESQGVDPYLFVFPEIPWATGERTVGVNILDNIGNFGAQFIKVDFR